LVDVGVTFVVTVVVAFAPGALVVTVLVLLAVCAARAGVATSAAAATDAINFFMLPPVSGQNAPVGGPFRFARFSRLWLQS
jgi:hypothetical protein